MTTALIKYDAACHALAEAKTTDEVLHIRDKAEGMRAYAKMAKNREMEMDAAEIRMRAERRLGEMIVAQKETEGLHQGGNPREADAGLLLSHADKVSVKSKPTLAEVGIDLKLSSKAQKLAAVPEDEFEGMLGEFQQLRTPTGEASAVCITRPSGGCPGGP